jgi:hypothetical protein
MRQPTKNELCVIGSWLLTGLCSAFMGLSSKVWLSLLWAMYGNRVWPTSTRLYLSSATWFAGIPAALGFLIWILWRRRELDRVGSPLQLGMHIVSASMLAFTFFAAIRPLLSTTFRLSQ